MISSGSSNLSPSDTIKSLFFFILINIFSDSF